MRCRCVRISPCSRGKAVQLRSTHGHAELVLAGVAVVVLALVMPKSLYLAAPYESSR